MTSHKHLNVKHTWKQRTRGIHRRLLIMVGLCTVIFLANLWLGTSVIKLGELIEAFGGHQSETSLTLTIFWDIRFPYALMAVVIGACLGLAGAELQTVLDNPLSSPFTLGFSAAAACGASIFILLDWHNSPLSQNTSAALCALAGCSVCAFTLHFLTKHTRHDNNSIILCGIGLLFSFQAITAFIQFLANEETLQNLVFWTLGSLSRPTWPTPLICLAILAVIFPFSLKEAPQLTLLCMGEQHARGLGVNVSKLRTHVLIRVSILCAIAVAFTGIIGFIGLIAPHIARRLVGENHRYYLPASTLCGAIILSLAALIGQRISPGVIMPTSIITALIGVPFFLYLVVKRRTS